VLLKVVAFTGDVSIDFLPVGKPDPGNFAHGRIGLFGGSCINTDTNATALRTRIESRRLAFVNQFVSSFAYQLRNCWHNLIFIGISFPGFAPEKGAQKYNII
jgi:hypothetical protein